MTHSALSRALRRALLASSSLSLGSCLVHSSCPDDGYVPPLAETVSVSGALAGNAPVDANGCAAACGSVASGDVVTCVAQSADKVLCIVRPFPCEGRRPSGLRPPSRRPDDGLSRHLADAAWLEAASVNAFRLLRRELASHGAPRRLLRAASRSARDECRHARATRALARRFGVCVPRVEGTASLRRSLLDLARENAVEGCVRETWGALVALHQAERAQDPQLRAVMAPIARDELRHAELAFRIESWLTPRLSPAERRQVDDSRRAAVRELREELAIELAAAERARLGLPGSEDARRMLAELDLALGLSRELEPAAV
jgi:hypothetical protein